jgi:ABC-type sugar transport system permease subunit
MRQSLRGHAYVTPSLILIALVLIAPSIYGLVYSLYDIRYLRATSFVDIQNYYYLITDPTFIPVLLRSLIFALLSVSLTMVIAMLVAMWINRLRGLFALVMQIVVILPWVISSMISSLLFQWVFVNDIGWAMFLLRKVGVTDFHPLSDPVTAMGVLVAFTTWRTLGFAMLLLLAGLKAVPSELYEAAHIDGTSAWQRFRFVTLPMLQTPLMITVVILTVSNLNNVEGPLIVTTGGPADATRILPLDLYMRAFAQFDFNSAIPLGIGMFAANILLAMAYVRLVKSDG